MNVAGVWRVVVVLSLTLSVVGRALAGEPTEQIKRSTNEILKIVKDPDLKDPAKAAERRKRVRAVTEQTFGWREMARRALGRYWPRITDKQKNEFVALFRDLIEQTYMAQIEGYAGEVIRYEGDKIDGDFALVKVTVVTGKNTEIPLVYRAFKKKEEARDKPPVKPTTRPATKPSTKWLVYDVSIEGVSLVNNYRTQIRDIMARSSYEELVKKLKAKIAEDAAAAPAPSEEATPPAKSDTSE